jgi:hypothetical protein
LSVQTRTDKSGGRSNRHGSGSGKRRSGLSVNFVLNKSNTQKSEHSMYSAIEENRLSTTLLGVNPAESNGTQRCSGSCPGCSLFGGIRFSVLAEPELEVDAESAYLDTIRLPTAECSGAIAIAIAAIARMLQFASLILTLDSRQLANIIVPVPA